MIVDLKKTEPMSKLFRVLAGEIRERGKEASKLRITKIIKCPHCKDCGFFSFYMIKGVNKDILQSYQLDFFTESTTIMLKKYLKEIGEIE